MGRSPIISVIGAISGWLGISGGGSASGSGSGSGRGGGGGGGGGSSASSTAATRGDVGGSQTVFATTRGLVVKGMR